MKGNSPTPFDSKDKGEVIFLDFRMDPKRLDGKVIAEEIQNEIVAQVNELKAKGCTPGLAVVLVGERKDSQTYVRMKKQLAEKVGMNFVLKDIPSSITQGELLKIVQDLNEDKTIHGLIVQLPLPEQINEKEILDAVSYEKDIDGFHPLNIGNHFSSRALTYRSTLYEGTRSTFHPMHTQSLH